MPARHSHHLTSALEELPSWLRHVYEAMFIFDSNRFGRDPGGVSGAIATLVQKFGGEMLASRLWEERRLAYPINGQRKGTYWLTYFRFDSRSLADFNREMRAERVDPAFAGAEGRSSASSTRWSATPSVAGTSRLPKPVEPAPVRRPVPASTCRPKQSSHRRLTSPSRIARDRPLARLQDSPWPASTKSS